MNGSIRTSEGALMMAIGLELGDRRLRSQLILVLDTYHVDLVT